MPCPGCRYVANNGENEVCIRCGHTGCEGLKFSSDSPKAPTSETPRPQAYRVPPALYGIPYSEYIMSTESAIGPHGVGLSRPNVSPIDADHGIGLTWTTKPPTSPVSYQNASQQESATHHLPVENYGMSFPLQNHEKYSPGSASYKGLESNTLRPDAKIFISSTPDANKKPEVVKARMDEFDSDKVVKMDNLDFVYVGKFVGPITPGTTRVSPSKEHQKEASREEQVPTRPSGPPSSPSYDGFRNKEDAADSEFDPPLHRTKFARKPHPNTLQSNFQQFQPSHETPRFLSSRRIDDYLADRNSPVFPFRLSHPDSTAAGLSSSLNTLELSDDKPPIYATPNRSSNIHATKIPTAQNEDWQLVDTSGLYNQDVQPFSNDASVHEILLHGTGVAGRLDTRYSLIVKPQRFFKVGRAFMTLWSEPASPTVSDSPKVSSSKIGARIFSETRRFVVVRVGLGYSLCCPIHTYQKRGTKKLRLKLENHAVVFAAGTEPKLLPGEEPPGMGYFPIIIEDKSVTIDPSSRLNFGKVYTVEHNIKVRNIGKISKEALLRLKSAFIKSMGITSSEKETETETETETEKMVSGATGKLPLTSSRRRSSVAYALPPQDQPEMEIKPEIEDRRNPDTIYSTQNDESGEIQIEGSSPGRRGSITYYSYGRREKANSGPRSKAYRRQDGSAEVLVEYSTSRRRRSVIYVNRSSSRCSNGNESSSSKPQGINVPRRSQFFINGDGIDGEVIATDICRYLGNDTLLMPGIFKDQVTGKRKEGYYITAYKAPTVLQLADLKANSLKWQEEKVRGLPGSSGRYVESYTRQEAMNGLNLLEFPLYKRE